MFQNPWPKLRPTLITEKKLPHLLHTFMFWVVNQQHNKTGAVSLREVFLGDRQENCKLPVLVRQHTYTQTFILSSYSGQHDKW